MHKKPMLAYPVSDKPIDYTKPVFMQPKLDGVRCLIQYEQVTPLQTGPVAYSRTGKEWLNIDHILQSLMPFFDKHPNVILDGELYNHDLKDDFEQIISCVRKTKPTEEHRAQSKELVQFHCYDIVDENAVFDWRADFIGDELEESYCVKHVMTTYNVDSEKQAKDIHQANLKAGYEGSIVRLNDVYQCKRSHSLRKFKDFHDAEAVIVDWVEGKGKRKGTIGKFVAVDNDGNKFGMPVMDNFKKLQTMFKEMQSWVGLEATFTYFERTKAGSYRHPLFKAIRDYE